MQSTRAGLVMKQPDGDGPCVRFGLLRHDTSSVEILLRERRLNQPSRGGDDEPQPMTPFDPAGDERKAFEIIAKWLCDAYQLCLAQSLAISGSNSIGAESDTAAIQRDLMD